MKKINLILFKFLSLVLLTFTLQSGISMYKSDINLGVTTIACNDTVEISMNFDCSTTVTPDQLLEGNYPDMSVFSVNIVDQNGIDIGDQINKSHIGYTLVAEVLESTTNNRCWSRIKIVDKVAPILECNEIYTTCFKDPIPGSLLPHNFRVALHPNYKIPDGDTLRLPFNFGETPGAVITDVNIRLNIDHERLLDLEAYTISPTNDTVLLFDNLTCANANMDVIFDDQAIQTSADLTSECTINDPSIEGNFKPIGSLATYNGIYPAGTWTLVVIDKNAGKTGKVVDVSILFTQNHGYVSFPIPNTSSTPIYLGDNKYRIASGFDACGEVILTYQDSLTQLDCTTEFTGVIARKWTAEDESGNISKCTQYIYIIRTGTSFLKFPPNYDNIDQPAKSCSNPNVFTGVPGSELCNMVTISSSDDTLTICSGSYKVIRHWKVTEMCSGEVIEHDQIIAFMDTEGPQLSNVDDVVLEADALECSTDIYLTFPNIISDCSDFDLMTYELGYQILDSQGNPTTVHLLTENIVKNGNQYILKEASVGRIKFTYTVTDDCGNSSSKSNIVRVYDNSVPSAVCDQHTQVVLGVDGTARVDAIVFDDGSNDNCSEVTFRVRRMEANCEPSDTKFRNTITFCCIDVNSVHNVELEVTDASNLKNSCMVEVQVIDKTPPVVKCPKPRYLECYDDYLDLSLTGDATAFDNCSIDSLTHTDKVEISQCNVGTVLRTWVAVDHVGFTSSCSQLITIGDSKKYRFKYSDIIWPSNKIFTDCVENFDTSITGSVKYRNEDICSMVAARYKDEVFNIVEGACKKILRHWEVIDWCNFDEDPEGSTWIHTQVIKLENTIAPVFDEECSNKTFCTYGECKGDVYYQKTATDVCTKTEELNWTYKIDLDNDGDWDIGPIHSNVIDDEFNNGTHRIAWTVEDGCGQSTSCEELMIVKDCKKPTPLCITELTTVVMNQVGMVRICAEDFNLGTNCYNCNTGSYDNCTPKEDLKYSFSTNVLDTCITYTCDSIPNGIQIQKKLQMWVTDEAGNQDYCTVFINIEDNEASICKDTTVGSIVYGIVYDPKDITLENVKLKLSDNEGPVFFNQTNENGEYQFNNISKDEDYILKGDIDSKYLLGVTTLDIVYIQKHLLGIKKFDQPYKYIAADVNKSKTISASDILAIRKLILGETQNFGSKSQNWSFVEDGPAIRNDQHILSSWNEKITINENSIGKNINIVGIKMGDVNSSSGSALKELKLANRSRSNTILSVDDKPFNKNDIVKSIFKFTDLENIEGGQFTLTFDNNLEFSEIELNNDLIQSNNISLLNVENGAITVSWIKPNTYNKTNGEIFSIYFKATNNGQLSKSIRLSDEITTTEAYNSDLETMDINLEFREANINEYALYQNIPNPFKTETTIMFDLPQSQKAIVKFFDVTGREIKSISKVYNKGRNSITVSFDKNVSGVIYYTIETGKFTETKKMINLR